MQSLTSSAYKNDSLSQQELSEIMFASVRNAAILN